MAIRQPTADRSRSGSVDSDLDIDLLSLVSAGCTIEQIMRELGLPARDVYRRLVNLRHFIEVFSLTSSTD